MSASIRFSMAAPTEQHNLNSTTITSKASSSMSLQQHDPKAMAAKSTGGSGKTFLYRALLATVRSKGFIALATATSGVATSILLGGRTAHSRFKIPINIDEQFSCNIIVQTFHSNVASLKGTHIVFISLVLYCLFCLFSCPCNAMTSHIQIQFSFCLLHDNYKGFGEEAPQATLVSASIDSI